MGTSKPEAANGTLDLSFSLAELPTSQHRAGLAGLVLACRWLERVPHEVAGTCRLSSVEPGRASLTIDRDGLASLLDQVYKAALVETASQTRWKNKEPLRIEEREATTAKGKKTTKKFFIYPQCQPDGIFLRDWDPSGANGEGIWVKLWRDTLWSILRGVPATRKPYQARAEGSASKDAERLWKELARGDKAVDLPSTYYLGAQAKSAENLPFRDRARFLFLLHFWPFVAQIYVPVQQKNDKREFVGYAICVPDVADLEWFCEELPAAMRRRDIETSGYRPSAALVDIAAESGLDVLRRLREQLERKAAGQRDLVSGVDVFHVAKQGNNVDILATTRIDPVPAMIDRYARARGLYWDPTFRRQQVRNILAGARWFAGYGALISTMPASSLFGAGYFCRDCREAFRTEASCEDRMTNDESKPPTIEELIYQVIGSYLARKVESKYQLRWSEVKDNPGRKAEYTKSRAKVAKDAFLAVRSRTGADFVDYFSSTLCSVPHYLPEERFVHLSRELLTDPATFRTLTLLALSARA